MVPLAPALAYFGLSQAAAVFISLLFPFQTQPQLDKTVKCLCLKNRMGLGEGSGISHGQELLGPRASAALVVLRKWGMSRAHNVESNSITRSQGGN